MADGQTERRRHQPEDEGRREGADVRFMSLDEIIADLPEDEASEGDEAIARSADHVIRVPDLGDYLTAILVAVPLQLLAYHVGVLRGTDVDQPRNLAKSVTGE